MVDIKSRRRFIKNTGTLAFSSFLLTPLQRLFASNRPEHAIWLELLDYARWCPTVHNLQPHKIKIISENEAELYYDTKRLLPVGDPNSIFITIAMGIFIEHISIAAAPHRLTVVLGDAVNPIQQGNGELKLFTKLRLVETERTEPTDRELMKQRRTSRLHYSGSPVKEDTLNRITSEAEKTGFIFNHTDKEEMVNLIIDMNQETLFEDLSSTELRNELDLLFRYNKKEASQKKDGLWSKCMGFSGTLMKSIFHHHERWEHGMRKKLLAHHYRGSFKGTCTIGWFRGNFENTTDWLNAGRMLARTWLMMTKDNVYIHPFGSLITNPPAYKLLNERLGLIPQDDKKLWMIFRAGYSEEPARSYRLDLNELLIT